MEDQTWCDILRENFEEMPETVPQRTIDDLSKLSMQDFKELLKVVKKIENYYPELSK